MEIVLALGSAFAYGISDFTGGVLTKRAHVFTVILVSQAVSAVILLVVLPFWGGVFSWRAIQWGGAAGVAGMAGAALLYRGLAIGRMGVVAPITAVLAAAIPVSFGLATGERPGSIALIGVGIGLVAVVLISMAPEPTLVRTESTATPLPPDSSTNKGIPEALGAGVGFGLFFIMLERAPGDSGIWPLVGTRISMLATVAVLAAIAGAEVRSSTEMGFSLAWLGFINLASDLLYLLATREGLLSLVAVITSLYPATTVGLARVVLDERMVKQQMLGVACAAVSVTCIALR
jgi:drug/metabolite transporter (DMT)-like permease